MNKYIKLAHHMFFLLKRFQYRKFLNILYIIFLRKYLKIYHRVFKKYPTFNTNENIKKSPILVYQMGKVGSSSVIFSLEIAYLKHKLPDVQIHHVHFLRDLDMHQERFLHKQPHKMHVIKSYEKIKYEFENNSLHWNVISLVRDPVARNVGAFFQGIHHYIPRWQEKWKNKTLTIEILHSIFLNTKEVHIGSSWFDNEINSVLNIDVYQVPFNRIQGFQTYANIKIDLLVLRLEDLNNIGETAIGDFLGIPDFSLYKSNISEEKEYAELYKKFKSLPLPTAYLDEIYETKYARHFYSDKELENFKAKWTKVK